MTQAIYEIKLDLEAEYKDLLNDMIKFSTVFFVGFFLYSSIYSTTKKFDTSVIEWYSFLIIGIVSYHLVVKSFVTFS